MNPSADQVLTLLPPDDVKIALQDRSKTAAASNKENGENRSANKTEAMEEDSESEECLDEEKVEKGASPSNVVYDQEANNEMDTGSISHKGKALKGKIKTMKRLPHKRCIISSDSDTEVSRLFNFSFL
jgi:hypothetical protein